MGLYVHVLLFLGTASFVNAGCPLIPAIANFDPDRFEGRWFPVEYLDTGATSLLLGSSQTCPEAEFTHTGNLTFLYSRTWKYEFGDAIIELTMDGTLSPISPNFPNYFESTMSYWMRAPKTRLYILDTNYIRHAILYSCTDYGIFGTIEMGWIYHRRQAGFTERRRTRVFGEVEARIPFLDTSKFIKYRQRCLGFGNFSTPAPV
ncbi:apolipoprotein D-like [Argopecten irradians]|uniref:apolipoprotein D-like n=1 Tax=Argopecten irradians TaxID=31199 RepID=UPI00371638BD